MKTEQDTTIASSITGSKNRRSDASVHARWISSPSVKKLVQQLPENTPCFVARAPSRLNIMGGIAEYTGSLVLHMPANDLINIAVQKRTQKEFTLLMDGCYPTIVPLSQLDSSRKNPQCDGNGKQDSQDDHQRIQQSILGTIVELQHKKLIPDFSDGLTIAVGRNHPGIDAAAEPMAVTSAFMVAVAALLEIQLDPLMAAEICQTVQNDWLGLPVGMSDALCTLQGQAQTICGLRIDPYTHDGSVHLTNGLRFVGVNCGAVHSDAEIKYNRVRVASFMGRTIIDRIIQHDGTMDMQWDGYLSRVSVTDFVERFRNRIPTKMKGQDFLDRFGDTDDTLTTIEPKLTYKIRSRTEHHIYEHTRCRQLMECLSRTIRNGDLQALSDAQSPINASHWSYGQRCGLGSIETDLLVNLIRHHGAGVEIFGAKISGRGCGGVVTVLMQDTKEASSALDRATNDYVEQTGLQITFLNESTPGAMISGAHQILL